MAYSSFSKKKYKVVTANSAYRLEQEVNDWIKLGYSPVGSMAIRPDGGFFSLETTQYSQSMELKE